MDSDTTNNDNDNNNNLNLDEEGFPQNDILTASSHDNNNEQDDEEEKEDNNNGFKAEFYRCGTDWSCLLSSSSEGKSVNSSQTVEFCDVVKNEGKERVVSFDRKKMKQVDLFRMWGLQNKEKNSSVDVGGSSDEVLYLRKKVKADLKMKMSAETSDKMSHLRKTSNGGAFDSARRRSCPFYKKIQGTTFTVDAFRYGCIEGCSAYFLTHFHSDHYGGLSKGWSYGPIYCTPLTARLVRMCLYVDPLFICPLELNIEHVIEGVKVTMLEANHCPGAALINFCLPNGQCYLHTGDFRASKSMQSYPLLRNQRVNLLFLDTTYCNPKYTFPSKEEVLNYVVKVTKNSLRKQPKTLVIVGAYSIGKECVYLAISKELGVKIYAHASRRRILQSFGWPDLSGSLCLHGEETILHVLPISHLRFEKLKDYLKSYKDQYNSVLAFRPTGWTFSTSVGNQLDLIKPNTRGNISIYGVPYSEHSSFTELQEFVQFLRPEKIIPTVNVGNASNREKMQSYFGQWLKR